MQQFYFYDDSDEWISCVFSSAVAPGLASLPFELVKFPGILLVLCFILLHCLPAPFALGLLLHLFSFPPLFSLVPESFSSFSAPSSFLQLSLLFLYIQPLIFRAYLMNRKNCCMPHFSLVYPGCRDASPHPLVELCLCCGHSKEQGRQVTALLEQTCSYRSQRRFVGWCDPSLNQQPDFRASVHVFSLLKAWCSNRLSSCNCEMGRGKGHGQYFCIFTPNVTQRAHQNRGSKILMLCWYLGVGFHPSFPACQRFFSLTYWMLFSSTEERKYQGFLQESCNSAVAVFVRSDLLEVHRCIVRLT